jgi:hypothetical protein
MKTENIQIKVAEGVQELIIREGEAQRIHEPNSIEFSGVISSPYEYLKKGFDPEEIINSTLEYSYELCVIRLNYAIRTLNPDVITGSMKLHEELKSFELNSGKRIEPSKMAEFLRTKMHYFLDRAEGMKLVKELQEFKAKVDKEIEKADDKRANVRQVYVQKVSSNIPSHFVLNLPVFVGGPKIATRVEIDIDPFELNCVLIAPNLKEVIDYEVNAVIGEQLRLISEFVPDLKLFQF